MSFRNTFITDFIYQAADEVKDANKKVTQVFKDNTDRLDVQVDERGYGYYAGRIRTHDLSVPLEELRAEDLVRKLSKVTKVPFKLTIMQESGAVITYNIEPFDRLEDKT